MLPPGETVLVTLHLPGTLSAVATRALAGGLRQAQAAGLGHHRAQKAFFTKFDAARGPRYFNSEPLAEALAGESMMLGESGSVVHCFAILLGHAHLTLVKALDLLHQRTAAAATSCAPSCHPKPRSDRPAGTNFR